MILTMLPNGRGRFEEDGLSFEGELWLHFHMSGNLTWKLHLDDELGTTISGNGLMKDIKPIIFESCTLKITGEVVKK